MRPLCEVFLVMALLGALMEYAWLRASVDRCKREIECARRIREYVRKPRKEAKR
jgi:hypothetical protein